MDNNYLYIDLEKLSFNQISIKKGIYFLYKNSQLVYIGKTKNLYQRLNDHLKNDNKIFDTYKFIEITNNETNIVEIETFFIQKFQPLYNKLKKKKTKRNSKLEYKKYKNSQKNININILLHEFKK